MPRGRNDGFFFEVREERRRRTAILLLPKTDDPPPSLLPHKINSIPSLRGGTTKQSVDDVYVMNLYFLNLITFPVQDAI